MTVGAAPPAGEWTPAPDAGVALPRGTSWGPSGYRGGDLYAPTPVAPARDGTYAAQPGAFYADDTVTAGGNWSDRATAADDLATRGYRRVGPGFIVPAYLRNATYFVSDWRGYGLGRPATGLRWMRYYDDALLIDGSGRVRDARYDIDWDRDGTITAGYADTSMYPPVTYDTPAAASEGEVIDGGVRVYRSGPNAPDVSVRHNPDGSTTVTVRNDPQVTTETRYVPVDAPPAPPPAPTYMAGRR